MNGSSGVAREITERLLRAAGFSLRVVRERPLEPDVVRLELAGADADLLLQHKGQLLDALQLVINKMLRRRAGGWAQLDVAGFRELRARELGAMAKQAAAQARSEQRAVTLGPLPPGERRLVHLALADEPGVRSTSEGDGELKLLHVVPE